MIDGRNLWELLEKRVEATPDAVMAVDETGRTLTFAQYKAEAERTAAGLARLGIGAGAAEQQRQGGPRNAAMPGRDAHFG